jgi:hypothetical protein
MYQFLPGKFVYRIVRVVRLIYCVNGTVFMSVFWCSSAYDVHFVKVFVSAACNMHTNYFVKQVNI